MLFRILWLFEKAYLYLTGECGSKDKSYDVCRRTVVSNKKDRKMTLIIRIISKNRSLYIADGRLSNHSGIITDSKEKIIQDKDLFLFAFSGILDDEHGDKRFNLIKAFENKEFQKCTNILLSRQAIIDTVITEYNKDIPATVHKCLLLYSIKSAGEIHNESIEIVKGKKYSFFYLKNGMKSIKEIQYAIEKTGIQFIDGYEEFMQSQFSILEDLKIDFNHLYIEGKESMPFYIKDIIPHIFMNSVMKSTHKVPSLKNVESLDQSQIDRIGEDFFQTFNEIEKNPQIGYYQMGRYI